MLLYAHLLRLFCIFSLFYYNAPAYDLLDLHNPLYLLLDALKSFQILELLIHVFSYSLHSFRSTMIHHFAHFDIACINHYFDEVHYNILHSIHHCMVEENDFSTFFLFSSLLFLLLTLFLLLKPFFLLFLYFSNLDTLSLLPRQNCILHRILLRILLTILNTFYSIPSLNYYLHLPLTLTFLTFLTFLTLLLLLLLVSISFTYFIKSISIFFIFTLFTSFTYFL